MASYSQYLQQPNVARKMGFISGNNHNGYNALL